MKIFLMSGPPYSGKGTQSKLLSEKFDLVHVSTGERIRLEKTRSSSVGNQMKAYEEQGLLVPDSYIDIILRHIIAENIKEKGIILDGFPRTTPQVDSFLEILSEFRLSLTCGLLLDAPKNILLARASTRLADSNRADDSREFHTKRLDTYTLQTMPAIEHLRTVVDCYDIDASYSLESVNKQIVQIMNHYL